MFKNIDRIFLSDLKFCQVKLIFVSCKTQTWLSQI